MTKTRPRFQTESIIKTWPMVRLVDVCEINLGKTPPRGNARFWDKERRDGYKWLSIADLANTQGGSVFDSKEYISKAAVDEVGVPVVLAGTFLLSFKLTLGRTAIAGCDLYTNEAIAAMPVKPAFQGLVDLQFLNLYCRFFGWEDFAAKDEKVLGKTLNKKKIAEVPLPLPPLSVQREIVARLERELAAVEKMKKGFEALAETARAEFKVELKEVFEKISRGGAETRRLGEVCELIPGFAFKSIEFGDFSNKVIRIGNINPPSIDFSDGIGVNTQAYPQEKLSKYVAYEGDCLVAMTGATIGKMGVMGVGRAYVNQRVLIVRAKSWLDQKYLSALLMSAPFRKFTEINADSKAAQPNISAGTIGSYEIPLPTLSAQREVVARLDGAKAKAEKLEAKAREGEAVCETMRKAILKEAFEGTD